MERLAALRNGSCASCDRTYLLDLGWWCELMLRRERWNAGGVVCVVLVSGPNRQVTHSVCCRRCWDAARVLTAWYFVPFSFFSSNGFFTLQTGGCTGPSTPTVLGLAAAST